MTTSLPPVAPDPASPLTLRVYYEDTDAGGIVFYANYLKFFERGRTEWLRAQGLTQSSLRATLGLIIVVRNITLSYRKPAKLDDLLTIHSAVTQISYASIHFVQQAHCEGELLVEGKVQLCCVCAESLKPMPLPTNLRTIFHLYKDKNASLQ